ncbi:uncharacterized protein [Rutidosis leptorrhynchoides]|uniref:uncharacterized protein n=1 Tax=Rutidosis leptorrhynchoides TaxID=125765 RepID=UPI003A99415D
MPLAHQTSVFLQTPLPTFLSAIHQNHSSSSSSHVQSTYALHSEPSTTALHSESSTSAFHSESSSHVSSFEKDELNDYENKLQREVEIIDEQGNVIRVVKMRTKEVYLLNAGEKILVHVNNLDQPIKAAGGLCTRFMTHLLQEPNTGLPSARNWRECKIGCGVRLLEALRWRFSLPQSENMDRVLFSIWDRAFRSLKFSLKEKLFKSVTEELNRLNYMGDEVAQERVYTEDELLDGLDLINVPPNFTDSEWNLYKQHLRSSDAKKLSLRGKRARADQVHNHTTSACSYARRRDEFLISCRNT